MPTVKLDRTRVTAEVNAVVRKCVDELSDIVRREHRDIVCAAAIKSITAGRDLALLTNAIADLGIEGMTRTRAADISRLINNRASARMAVDGQRSLGIRTGVWRYSGAPCMVTPKRPTDRDRQQDEAHRAADGKVFDLAEGMLVGGVWTMPGCEEGCRCTWSAVMPF